VLEINPEAGEGYGEVRCEYKVEGEKVVEPECVELEFEGIAQKAVTLKAVPEEGSEFVEFEGGEGSAEACNGKANPCSFTLNDWAAIEARFEPIEPTLAVEASGMGEVACIVEGLEEPCEGEEFEFGAKVQIEAEPEEGWEFAKFQNGAGSASVCNGKPNPCSFSLKENSALEVVFVPATYSLTVSKTGTGSGTVTSAPAGVSCGATCTGKFAEGAEVTLSATPASGSNFAGWSGAGCSGTGPCVVTIGSAAAGVTATFTASSSPNDGPKVGIARVGPRAKVKGRRARVKLTCSGGLCRGTLKLRARVRRGRRPVTIGRTPFTLAAGEVAFFPVKISAAARRQLRKVRILRARAMGTGVTSRTVKLRS